MILLTGAEGFIGSSLISLYDEDWLVTRGDIVDGLEFDGLDITGIIHCAGDSIVSRCENDPLSAFRNNFMATATVLEKGRHLRVPIVVLESDKVYGEQNGERIDEEAPLNGFSPYEKSKVLTAELCDFYRDYYDAMVYSLRLTNTYGPLDTNLSRLIPGTIDRLRRGEAPMVWTGSENMARDYLWIEDLCSVIMTLVRGGFAAGAYNVTSEENYSTREVIDIIQEEMGTDLPILYREKKFSEIRYQSMDGSKLRNELGFGPSTSLRDGIRKMLDKQ